MALYTEIIVKPPQATAEMVKSIKTIQRRMLNCTPVFRRLQPQVVEMHKQHFKEANQPSKWILKPSTIKLKKRAGYPLTPLVRTGKMREAIGNLTPPPTPNEMRVGTDGWPAVIHHHGVPKGSIASKPNYSLPKRQYVGVTQQEAQRVRDKIHRYIIEGKI